MSQDFYVVCDNLRSLYNVGSIFRTADAVGVKKIYLVGITGKPPQRGIAKVALGAEKSVAWEHTFRPTSLIRKLKKQGVQLVALEQTKKSSVYTKFKPQFPLALILGNELSGVSPNLLKLADQVIYLPQQGIKESLNVAVAFGVIAYYLRYH